MIEAPPLTDLVITFDHYFEVVLHFYAWGLVDDRTIWPLTRELHNVYGFQREELLACLKACEKHFAAQGRSVLTLQECVEKLCIGPPLQTWPERSQLRPGHRLQTLDIPTERILNVGYNWAQAIARKAHK
jgi:hypothetical protein